MSILLDVVFIVLALPVFSNAVFGIGQREPVLLYRYFGDQIAETFLALDTLSVELTTHPDTQGYLIIQNGLKDPPGLPYRHSLGAREYLVKTRNISPDRIEVVFGRHCEIFSVDVWLVGKGAKAPEQKCTFETDLEYTSASGKFDEYFFDYEHPDGSLYSDPSLRLDGFGKGLLKDTTAVGYIIGYGQRQEGSRGKFVGDKYVEHKYEIWDRVGTGKRIADREKMRLTKRSKLHPARVLTINGGYRESQMIELWILPFGAPRPKPTPTIHRSSSSR